MDFPPAESCHGVPMSDSDSSPQPLVLDALHRELGNAIEFVAPKGGLFVWARLTGADGQLANGNELAKRAIDKGVAFVPGTPFYATNPDHATLRLSFATVGPDKIVEGVGRLAAALQASA